MDAEIASQSSSPRVRSPWLFWLTAGALSAFFAEATCGSMPLVLVSPIGLLLTYPVYALHLWTLGGWALRRSRSSLLSLYLAGTVFGLYEAYITKVLWSPPWYTAPAHPWRIGGVAVVETVMLALFWHPVMAFVVPTLVAERWLTGRRTLWQQLPARARSLLESRRAPVIAATAVGLIHGTLCKSLPIALLSSIGSIGVLLGLAALWRRSGAASDSDVGDLLPQGRPLFWLSAATLGLYVVLGNGIRRELLPGLGPQATIWALYVVFGGLMVSSVRAAAARRATAVELIEARQPLVSERLRTCLIVFVASSAVAGAVLGRVPMWAFVVIWVVGVPSGCILFARGARAALRPATA